MSKSEEQILDHIDAERDRLIEFYRAFVMTPSVWNHAAPLRDAAKQLAAPLEEAGFEVELRDSGTPDMWMVAAELRGTGGGPTLMFNGHMEVYPPSESWSMDPFGGTIREGRLYGQGAADMKAGTAAGTMACQILAAHAGPHRGTLRYLVIPNHFEGGEGTWKALRDGFGADLAINCEPTGLQVTTGQRGILYLTITTHGRAAHTTATDIGVNAIARMARVIEALQQMRSRDANGGRVDAETIVNVAEIEGGLAHNLIPERCQLTVDIRFPPEQTQEDVLRDVHQAVAMALPNDEFKTEVVPEDTCVRNPRYSLRLPNDHPLATVLATAHQDAAGSEATFGFHPAWPDTPIFNEMGVPAITYGPGSMDCYWDDEAVELDDYITAIKTYSLAGMRILAGN
jgi:acetylornithine deacetylase/succinyl-diaminopimelate desuccinylase-like protein